MDLDRPQPRPGVPSIANVVLKENESPSINFLKLKTFLLIFLIRGKALSHTKVPCRVREGVLYRVNS